MVRGFLLALEFSLPGGLLFAVYRGFNNAVSRPKAVMALQLTGLALKVPLAALLVYGAGPLPALGVTGCGVSTAIAVWFQVAVPWQVIRRDRFYQPFALFGHGLRPPNRAAIVAQLNSGPAPRNHAQPRAITMALARIRRCRSISSPLGFGTWGLGSGFFHELEREPVHAVA